MIQKAPDIAALAAMEDAELMETLGLLQKLQDAKANLDKMVKLKGKAREYAEQRVEDMLTPRAYPDEFGWILEEAERKGKGGKESMADGAPISVLD